MLSPDARALPAFEARAPFPDPPPGGGRGLCGWPTPGRWVSLSWGALTLCAERPFAGRSAANRPVRGSCDALPRQGHAAFGGRLRRSLTRQHIAGAWR